MKAFASLLFFLSASLCLHAQNLRYHEAYDFEVGDEFHFEVDEVFQGTRYLWRHERLTITGRSQSAGKDSILYQQEWKVVTFRGTSVEHYSYTTTKAVAVKSDLISGGPRPKYSEADSTGKRCLTNLPSFTGHFISELSQRNADFFDRPTITHNEYRFIDTCLEHWELDARQTIRTYSKGLGLVREERIVCNNTPATQMPCKTIDRMIYFKKGQETGGTRSIYVSAAEADVGLEVQLGPNPVAGLLQLHINEPFSGELRIIDLNGREAYACPIRSSHSLHSLSALKPGIYQLLLSNSQGISYTKRLLKR